MAQYRKIDTRMWGDQKFRTLSEKAKFLWVYLLTGPETTSLPGVIVGGPAHFSECLNWDQKAFLKAFDEVSRIGLVKADWEARFVWVPNAIRYNFPQSPNVVVSWKHHWDAAPECELKAEAFQVLIASMEAKGEAFLEAFRKACEKAIGIQDQDQDQDQDQTERSRPVETGLGPPPQKKETEIAKRVFDHWRTTLSPNAKRSDKRIARIRARLAEKFTEEELIQAIDGVLKDDWLMGRDPKARKGGWRDIDTIFRDAAQVERLKALANGSVRREPRESKNPAHQPFPEPKEPQATKQQKLAGLEIGKELMAILQPDPPRANGKKPPASAPESPSTAPSGQNGTPPAETTESSL